LDLDGLLQRAIKLACRGTGLVEPNPRVGALVVREGEVVGEGWHREYGGPHAEVVALAQAGPKARGADLISTLEPCSVPGKTEPCTDALIATGIKRVFFPIADPNPVNGHRAGAVLREAGIEVVQVPEGGAALDLIRDFRTYLKGTLPWTVLKWAMTADGKVATVTGESRWISSEGSRHEVHEERGRADAVLVGRVTIKTDDPDLTARLERPVEQPVRVILDSGLHLDPASRVAMTASEVPTWVFHCPSADGEDRKEALEALGVRVIEVPMGDGGRLDVAAALRVLRREGLHRILVEGGPTVHGALISGGLADWARVYVAPLILGGITAPGPVAGSGFASLKDAVWLADTHLRVVGGASGSDFCIEGRITNHLES
jgi:diaminohydroxyphosphoribosylaminopyrimidine deaminase/5-amino-6-(5-phosphoribosylamino)uracil reductase